MAGEGGRKWRKAPPSLKPYTLTAVCGFEGAPAGVRWSTTLLRYCTLYADFPGGSTVAVTRHVSIAWITCCVRRHCMNNGRRTGAQCSTTCIRSCWKRREQMRYWASRCDPRARTITPRRSATLPECSTFLKPWWSATVITRNLGRAQREAAHRRKGNLKCFSLPPNSLNESRGNLASILPGKGRFPRFWSCPPSGFEREVENKKFKNRKQGLSLLHKGGLYKSLQMRFFQCFYCSTVGGNLR